jgi:NodT family efflux transporter outer membrane factor (OMF) lipoprotein
MMRTTLSRYSRPALTAALLVPLAACSLFAPSGTPPVMPAPAHYGVAAQPADTVAAQGQAQHFELGAHPVPDWWTRYQSPALNALVLEGMHNNASVSAALKQLAGAREVLRGQINSSLLPSIDANGQTARQRALGMPAFGPQTVLYNDFVGQLQASYTLDLFGAAHFADVALARNVQSSELQTEAAYRSLAANIVTAAITSSALAAQIDDTRRVIELAHQQTDDEARRAALGAASRTDLASAQQNAAALEAGLPALEQQHATTQHALAVLLGRTPDQAPPDIPLDQLHLPTSVPVVVPSELLHTRPDIQSSEALLRAAAAQVGVATAQLFPQLTLSAGLGQGGFSWPSMLSGAGGIWSLGASVSQPIFHAGALLAKRRAAKYDYEAAVDQYKQSVLTAFQDVADTLAALEHDAQTLDAANRSASAAQIVSDDTAARVRLGALPPTSARSAEQQYRNAQLDEIRAKGARLADTARLFQAMGTPDDPEQMMHRFLKPEVKP